MSRKSPEQKAWRQHVLAAKAAEAAQPAPARAWRSRDARTRLLVAGAVWLAVTAVMQALFIPLANRLGVVTFVELSSPITVTRYVGRNWYTTTLTSDHTTSWLLLVGAAMTVAFWISRAVFFGDVRAAFTARWLWLIAGWLLGLLLLVVWMQWLIPVLYGGPAWLTTLMSEFDGWVELAVFAAWGQLFSHGWRYLMRLCRVPAKDAFTGVDG